MARHSWRPRHLFVALMWDPTWTVSWLHPARLMRLNQWTMVTNKFDQIKLRVNSKQRYPNRSIYHWTLFCSFGNLDIIYISWHVKGVQWLCCNRRQLHVTWNTTTNNKISDVKFSWKETLYLRIFWKTHFHKIGHWLFLKPGLQINNVLALNDL